MRFSTALSVCAAPLALASSLQAELFKRGAVDVEVATGGGQSNSKNNNNNNNGNSIEVAQSSTSVTEVIIIWVNNGGNSATSTVNPPQALGTTAGAAAATHTVVVGGTAGLVYTPNTINAAVGDMVMFQFMSNNHTATQSAFTTPCDALAGGMDSGFMPNINNTVSPAPAMAMQVTVATPIWFYCKQTGHCGKGMTFSINPTANKTQAMFEQMAIAQNGTGAATPITGGTSSAAPAAPPVASVASAAPPASSASTGSSGSSGSSGLTSGSGTLSNGQCDCSCLCGVAAFPSAAQGLNAFGGMSGSMPMSALMA